MASHTVQITVTDGALRVNATFTEEVGGAILLDEVIAAGAANLAVAVAVPLANLKTFILFSDQDVTVKTNSSTVPDETFNMKAGKPVVWAINGGGGSLISPPPIGGPIASLFISNATALPASVKLLAGYDPTP